jgi:hypothetical protein
MKRIIIVLAAILAWQFSQARVIPEDQARRNAANFFASVEARTKASASTSDLKLIWSFPEVATKAGEEPALYVFERPGGGYAVAAGDDVALPILGYSLDGRFPSAAEMPEGMRDMFQFYADVINYARSQGWISTATKAPDPDPTHSKVLTTAKWHQGSPFNDLVPVIKGETSPVGCVATATAIIMQYHQWPEKGTGTIPDYTYDGRHIDGVELDHVYNWAQMPQKATGFSKPEAAQVARLSMDLAVMYKMQFYPDGSGAYTSDAYLLTKYFSYDKQMQIYDRNLIPSDEKWEQIMRSEIDANRPVLYSGYDKDWAGHAFVIDGYSSNHYFSINYGWGAGSEFFTLTPVEGHEDDLTEFTKYQTAIGKIMPDQGGQPEPTLYVGFGGPVLPYDFEKGKDFVMSDCCIFIESFIPTEDQFKYDLVYNLYDSDWKLKEKISPEFTVETRTNKYVDLPKVTCRVTKAIEAGDRIALAVKDASGKWAAVSDFDVDNCVFMDDPLSDLAEMRFDGMRADDATKSKNGEDLYVYINAFKDIPWAIFKEGRDEPVMRRCLWNYVEEGRALECEVEEDLWGRGLCRNHLWLPTGSYKVVFLNPLTGEKMTVNLEL